MLDNAKITNTDELEFAVFCIENIAVRLGKNKDVNSSVKSSFQT